jgi:partitioning defective protein 6
LIERLHGINGIQFNIFYTDKDGDLLPINNDNNLARVLQVTAGLLRLIVLRTGECYNTDGYMNNSSLNLSNHNNLSYNNHHNMNHSNSSTSGSYRFISQIKSLKDLTSHHQSPKPFSISYPADFRPVSAIIDVDILPDSYRRVRLHKHKSSKPLGFYIRDGRSLRVTPNGVEQVPGIFISRLMPGGLAESTGLLSVNDEVIEVNGIEVGGKTLDQVTDMMIANSSNLIITVKPTNQRYNLNKSSLSRPALSTNHSLNERASFKQTSAQSASSSINSSFSSSQSQQNNSSQQQHQHPTGNLIKKQSFSQQSSKNQSKSDQEDDDDEENGNDDDDDDDEEILHNDSNAEDEENADDKILTL